MKKIINNNQRKIILSICACILLLVSFCIFNFNPSKTEDTLVEDNFAMGGFMGNCRHFDTLRDSYHSITATLINHVGEQNFKDWIDYISKGSGEYAHDDCPYEYINIVRFVQDFNIPREDFQAILDNTGMDYYAFDYNLDVIYSGDKRIIEEYYCSGKEREKEYLLNELIYEIKIDLYAYVRDNHQNELAKWVDEKNYFKMQAYSKADIEPVLLYAEEKDNKSVAIYSSAFTGDTREWNIFEFVSQFDISREKFTEIVERYTLYREPTEKLSAVVFDIDLLYSSDYALSRGIDFLVDSAEIDFNFVKIDEQKLKSINEAIINNDVKIETYQNDNYELLPPAAPVPMDDSIK